MTSKARFRNRAFDVMSFCDSCHIEEKLMQCCGKLPMTGERAALTLSSGQTVMACPRLSPAGLCSSYADRPQGCREFHCDAFMTDARSPAGGR